MPPTDKGGNCSLRLKLRVSDPGAAATRSNVRSQSNSSCFASNGPAIHEVQLYVAVYRYFEGGGREQWMSTSKWRTASSVDGGKVRQGPCAAFMGLPALLTTTATMGSSRTSLAPKRH